MNVDCNDDDVGCPVQFSSLTFKPGTAILSGKIVNSQSIAFKGGHLEMTTQGYGCVFIICKWADGPILDDPTCSWPGMDCDGETLVGPFGEKEIEIDFSLALVEASKQTGCCSNDKSCKKTGGTAGCMMKGTATFSNDLNKEYAKVYIEITCDLKKKTCSIHNPSTADESVSSEVLSITSLDPSASARSVILNHDIPKFDSYCWHTHRMREKPRRRGRISRAGCDAQRAPAEVKGYWQVGARECACMSLPRAL